MKNDSTKLLPLHTEAAKVTSVPLSDEIIAKTCLNPFLLTTLFGLCTIVTAVSSMFHMSCGSKLYCFITHLRFSQKSSLTSGYKCSNRKRMVSFYK